MRHRSRMHEVFPLLVAAGFLLVWVLLAVTRCAHARTIREPSGDHWFDRIKTACRFVDLESSCQPGTTCFCATCTATVPCASGATGATAVCTNAGTWSCSSVAAPTGGTYEGPCDLPPASPSPLDDECNSATVNANWTAFNGASETFTGGVKSAYCVLHVPQQGDGSAGHDNVRFREMAVSGTFTLVARMDGVHPALTGPFGGFFQGGITVRNSTTSKFYVFGSSTGNAFDDIVMVQRWDQSGACTPYCSHFVDLIQSFNAVYPQYWRVDVSATNILFSISSDGCAWRAFYGDTLAGYIGSVDRIGIGADPNNATIGMDLYLYSWRKLALQPYP